MQVATGPSADLVRTCSHYSLPGRTAPFSQVVGCDTTGADGAGTAVPSSLNALTVPSNESPDAARRMTGPVNPLLQTIDSESSPTASQKPGAGR